MTALTRETVAQMLADVHLLPVPTSRVMAELCRRWLAVEDAPTGQSLGMVIYHDSERFAADNEGQRVRLVVVGEGE